MDTNKEIRIYGTLVNWTIDPNKQGTAVTTVTPRGLQHYDAVAYAKHLYDDQFGDPTPVNNFQDVINRRVTGITYDNGTTTIAGNTVVNNLTVNGTVAGLSLNDLSDVNAASPANGQYLKYNGSAWVPTTLQIALSDIAMPSASAGQVLKYDGTKWVAGNDNDTQGSTTLAGLTDTSISSPASGQALKYDGSKWVNGKLSLSDIALPAATEGQVLKFDGTNWVAGTDNEGLGGSGVRKVYTTYTITLNKVAYRITNPQPFRVLRGWRAIDPTIDHVSKASRPFDNYTYLYVAQSPTVFDSGESIVSTSDPSPSETNQLFMRRYSEDYSGTNLSDNTAAQGIKNVNGTETNVSWINAGPNRMTDSDYTATTSRTVNVTPGGSSGGFDTYSTGNLRKNTTTAVTSYIDEDSVAADGTRYAYATGTYNELLNADDLGTYYILSNGRITTYTYENLTTSQQTAGYTTSWYSMYETVTSGKLNQYYTSITKQQYMDNLPKWSNGSMYITIPANTYYSELTLAKDCTAPNELTYTIVTEKVVYD